MAETREGGVYAVKVGDTVKYVDANRKEVDKPTKAEEQAPDRSSAPAKPSGSTPATHTDKQMPYAELLAGAGFDTPQKVQDASDAKILEIEGIGPARLAEIRAYKG